MYPNASLGRRVSFTDRGRKDVHWVKFCDYLWLNRRDSYSGLLNDVSISVLLFVMMGWCCKSEYANILTWFLDFGFQRKDYRHNIVKVRKMSVASNYIQFLIVHGKLQIFVTIFHAGKSTKLKCLTNWGAGCGRRQIREPPRNIVFPGPFPLVVTINTL